MSDHAGLFYTLGRQRRTGRQKLNATIRERGFHGHAGEAVGPPNGGDGAASSGPAALDHYIRQGGGSGRARHMRAGR